MPIYDWKCSECGEITATIQSFRDHDVPPEKCDKCGTPPPKFERVIGRTSFQLTGRGWFRDGYEK